MNSDETPEIACVRGAVDAVRHVARELNNQLGQGAVQGEPVSVSIGYKMTSRATGGRTSHYFLISATGVPQLLDPAWQLYVDPTKHKMGIWLPYEWVALDTLSNIKAFPEDAVDVCRQFLNSAR